MQRLFYSMMLLFSFVSVQAQDWKQSTDDYFTVLTASSEDERYLPEVFSVLQKAKADLKRKGYVLAGTVTLTIHPSLESFQESSKMPWFVAATSDRDDNLIQVQRLQVLKERSSLTITLRHELFHLAQPLDWSRWHAEGEAMLFAGEQPTAEPFRDISEEELEAQLRQPGSTDSFYRAMATAYLWTTRGKP